MPESMIKAHYISKQYLLGQIGGTILRDELQLFSTQLHRKHTFGHIIYL